ncbi:arginase family protein [Conexibacter sp. SYSU D00693]|uniref:arginase family protein n=1 Tax=Conexibacter sp. SYSU D00693 TaxID=2812560 RepID=UPI00196A8F61|nr:arginase family protein [Conexibacter sp. SYSU D00693]
MRISALLCRTSDRAAGGAGGAQALAKELGDRLGVEPRLIGTPGEPRDGTWEDDLRGSRGCILEAGGQVDDALADGVAPILLAGDCTVSLTTIPAVLRHEPDVRVLWLDAHGDFNTPDTTVSKFLGGMCLSGACGIWDAGMPGPQLDPSRVVTYGVRDLEGPEQVLLETNGVGRATRPSTLAESLRGHKVFVHLDCDVLDPELLPGSLFPAPGGLRDGELAQVLGQVAGEAEVVGLEVTALASAEHAPLVADCLDPLFGL